MIGTACRSASQLRTPLTALADQAVVSIGNFAVNIILARQLNTAAYGQFVLIWSTLLFFNNLHSSLIIYPLAVTLSTPKEERHSAFTTSAFLFTLFFFVAELLLLAGAAAALNALPLLLPIASCLLFWQIQEVCRRCLLSKLRFASALPGDFISYVCQALAIATLIALHSLTLPNIFLMMSATSIVGALLQWFQARVTWTSVNLSAYIREFWNLGRWGFAINFLGLLPGPALIWVLTATHGSASAGFYQALLSVVGVTHPILFGLSNAMVPSVANALEGQGLPQAIRAALRLGGFAAILVGPYLALLILFPRVTLSVFYGAHSPYTSLGWLLPFMASAYLLVFCSQVIDGLAFGLKLPKINFDGQVTAAVVACVIAIPGSAIAGLKWSVWGFCLLTAGRLITQAAALRAKLTLLGERGLAHARF